MVHEDVVGALADPDLVRAVGRLPVLVEGHHNHRGAVRLHDARVASELVLADLSRKKKGREGKERKKRKGNEKSEYSVRCHVFD